MMRPNPLLFLAGGVLAAGLALSTTRGVAAQDPGPPPAPAPVDNHALVVRIQDLEQKVATLQAWVDGQRAQAKLTTAALGEAEAAGFTAGPNFRSREVLIAAWRAAAEAAQAGAAPAPAAPAKGRGSRPDNGR